MELGTPASFQIARAADAQRRLEEKEQFGKIVLEV
jgi:hypothetical protein